MNEVRLFENSEFGKVRVVMKDGEPWFVARDVAKALGYVDTTQAIRMHCEKSNDFRGVEMTPSATPMKIIPEEDVYALIFGSQLESARKFKRWVCDEVLPSIRKTGGYGKPSVPPSIKEKIECARAVLECAGLEANQLTLAVDRIHFRELGYSAVEATGVVLVAPVQEQMLAPTEIGRLLSPALSARLVNTLLEERGYQYKVGDKWSPTEKGKAIGGQLRDTAKWHRSGAPVLQLRWPESIVGVLKEEEISTY